MPCAQFREHLFGRSALSSFCLFQSFSDGSPDLGELRIGVREDTFRPFAPIFVFANKSLNVGLY
jgi:hypothetical protein